MKVKSESEVAQSCLTLHDPVDRSLPGSSIHGIVQARVQAWVAIAFYEILILINCKKDSDHPFHKSYRKKFFSHQENPLNFCKVQFCEVFGWMGSSRVQVCVAFCWCDLVDGITWECRRGRDELHPIFCVDKALDILWFEAAHEMGSFKSLAENHLSGIINEGFFQKEHLTEIFAWGRAISHPYESGEKGSS